MGMGAMGQGVSYLCAHHSHPWVPWEQPSPRGDSGGDIPVPWIPCCLFWGCGAVFGGFGVASRPGLPPENALPGGQALRAVFPVPAESRADGCIQTRSESATAAGESAHGAASGSSRSVGPAARCCPPPCQLPGTPGAQLSSPSRARSLLTVALFASQQTARLVRGWPGRVVPPARPRGSPGGKERAFSPKSCRGGQRNKLAN